MGGAELNSFATLVLFVFMSTPQVEDGYTAIANTILEKLAQARLSGSEWQIVIFIFRKTYGYKKKEDWISLSQFEQGCGIDRKNVCRYLKRLVAKQMIFKNENRFSFNKNYTQWVVAKQRVVNLRVAKQMTSSGETDDGVVAKQTYTKTNITKETNTKEIVTNVTTTAPPVEVEKKDSRNKKINEMLISLKGRIGIGAFADSGIERNMAKHCWSIYNQLGKEEFLRRLDFLLHDEFHHKNCNKIKYVYNQIKGFIEPKAKEGRVAIIS